MRLPLTIIFAISSFIILNLGSCSSTEDAISKPPYLSQLHNTECMTRASFEAYNSRADTDGGSFEMTFDGGVARCKFTSLDYPCDFGKVNVKVSFGDGVMTIVEFPSHDKADCRCETDATFTIMNVPEKDFILKLYHGNTAGHYNENSPIYVGAISIDSGTVTIPYHK